MYYFLLVVTRRKSTITNISNHQLCCYDIHRIFAIIESFAKPNVLATENLPFYPELEKRYFFLYQFLIIGSPLTILVSINSTHLLSLIFVAGQLEQPRETTHAGHAKRCQRESSGTICRKESLSLRKAAYIR